MIINVSMSYCRTILIALIATLSCLGCNRDTTPANTTNTAPPAATPVKVTIFAAASLADALGDIKKDLSEHNVALADLNLAASGTLAQQIENGAPADLFLSASVEWADTLAKKDFVARRSDALGNKLVL